MPDLISKYQIQVVTPNGTLIADLQGMALTAVVKITRNRPEEIYLRFDLKAIEEYCRKSSTTPLNMFAVGVNEIRVKRGARFLVGGQIMSCEVGMWQEQTDTLIVRAYGFLELLAYRYTDTEKVFTQIDAGTIAWTLINESQGLTNGDFGITQGTIESSIIRDRTYERKNIKEAIIDLSEVINGFDFEFTYDKQFKVYYPRMGTDREDAVFERPGNIKQMEVPQDVTKLVNQAIVRGGSFGELGVLRDDLPSQATFKLRQQIFDFNSVKEIQTLEDHGDAELETFSQPFMLPKIVVDGNQPPVIGEYWVGDSVMVKIRDSMTLEDTINGLYKVEQIEIRMDQEEAEEITLTLR